MNAVLMSVGSRVRNFRVIHGYWQLVQHNMLEGGKYRCSVGVARGVIWELVHGGHI